MQTSMLGIPLTADQLADRYTITELLYCHSRALDRLDAGLMKIVYWEDAEVDYGGFKGRAHEFADHVMKALATQYQLTQHRISNTLMTRIESDRIHTESYCFAKHLSVQGDQEMLYTGRYLDQFVKRDGRWGFIHRCVVMDWSRRFEVRDERGEGSFAALTKGDNTAHDPSFSHLSGQ